MKDGADNCDKEFAIISIQIKSAGPFFGDLSMLATKTYVGTNYRTINRLGDQAMSPVSDQKIDQGTWQRNCSGDYI